MRQRIMIAAVEEVNRQGVKFTMNDLARRLGVSKRSLYEHFDSKEELISAIVDATLENVREQRKTIIQDGQLSFQDKLVKILTIRQTLFARGDGRRADEIRRFLPAEWRKIEDFMDEEWGMIEAFLQQGIVSGDFRPIFLPIIHKMVKGAIKEFMEYDFLLQHNVSFDDMVSYMADILMYGITASKK